MAGVGDLQTAIISFIASFALSTSSIVFIVSPLAQGHGSQDTPISPLTDQNVVSDSTTISPNAPTPEPTTLPTPSPDPTPSPSPTPRLIPKPSIISSPTPIASPVVQSATGTQIDEWLTKYANEFQVERGLLYKIALCESKMNQFARNGDYGGLYQFASNTWINTRRSMNQDIDVGLRFNAEEAIKTAAYKIAVSGSGPWANCVN